MTTNTFIMGPSLPHKYFVASGIGETDVFTSSSSQESITYEPNSYDIATLNAGIPNVNTVQYSSILPSTAIEIHPGNSIPFGSILGAIKAQENGTKGTRLTASIYITELAFLKFNIQTQQNEWDIFGNFVTEYGGQKTLPESYFIMFQEVLDMMIRRKYGSFFNVKNKFLLNLDQEKLKNFQVPTDYLYSDNKMFRFKIKRHLGESFICEKQNGTAIAGVFIYEYKINVNT